MKKALVTGIAGQDGSYLTERLVAHGYHVCGIDHLHASFAHFEPLGIPLADPGEPGLSLVRGDITDGATLKQLIYSFAPDEIYNLASQSRPDLSDDLAVETYQANLLAVVQILDIMRRIERPIRLFQACTCEIFGNARESPQTEQTPIQPRNPYGISKTAAFWHANHIRERYGLFVSHGILYNHESPRRGENYVTRKITLAAARIKLGQMRHLVMGDLTAVRDWGFAGDTVRAMHLMLQAPAPGDYIIATGQGHSVADLLAAAFGRLELDWRDYVQCDEHLLRGETGAPLVGDASKARRELHWAPEVNFEQMIGMMVDADLQHAREHPLSE